MKQHNSLTVVALLLLLLSSTTATSRTPDGWTANHSQALQEASLENRKILLMFTGSDWCIWCKRLHEEILDTSTFMQWAADNLILVYIDFPRNDYLSPEVREQNNLLDERYGVSGYPTVIITDAEGHELKRLSYMEGGPKTFIRAIKRIERSK